MVIDSESMRAVRNAVQRVGDRLNDRYGGVIDRIRGLFAVELAIRTVREIAEDDVPHIAAGVAYYALFSIFPLILGLISILGFFVEPDEVQGRVIAFTSGFLPGSEDLISANIDAVIGLRGALGFFSLLGLIWSGSAMFGALNRAVNRAWDIHTDRPIYISKPRQLVMAICVGGLFALSMVCAAFVRAVGESAMLSAPVVNMVVNNSGRIALQAMSFILVLMIFLMVYRFMPNTKTYWRYIWPGALVSAALFELSKNLFIIYIERTAYHNVYGSVAPVMVLLFWAYVSSLIILLGAEICSEYERMKHNVERGVLRHHRRGARQAAAARGEP